MVIIFSYQDIIFKYTYFLLYSLAEQIQEPKNGSDFIIFNNLSSSKKYNLNIFISAGISKAFTSEIVLMLLF